MDNTEDFRFEAHKYLLEMDAAVTELMMLVVSGKTCGAQWDKANARYDNAHTEWARFLRPMGAVPMSTKMHQAT
ncbi:hypothetical protein OR626_24265 [Pseudomonas sp. S1Bt30]|jgi:hypothetical protein|uniref:Uncharacterized protein n=1 Tax=Pseudomonas quebecensis TaxID=2995174 RepID=A0ABY6QM78_9PSED|nr:MULTISPECIES: hypothetical protein [Pseudomonas]MCP1511037.1 hypothetical protein [Pseudomonas rhodesiae]MCX4067332.1 hypothetical protein [Pseudomonas quebecensis]MDF9769855.1 hypothetical protein [Pseudomonas rhodesiae]UZW21085.1 hypothetical protein OSC50_12335 [Pseudomonas quebecensis]UZW21498.1 hypothetical protein OSC48_13145 [Pseudomonas quebecensis]